MKERRSYEEIDGLENTLTNICPQFPVNYVTKSIKNSMDITQRDSNSNIQDLSKIASKVLNKYTSIGLFHFKMNSLIGSSGKSFGSK